MAPRRSRREIELRPLPPLAEVELGVYPSTIEAPTVLHDWRLAVYLVWRKRDRRIRRDLSREASFVNADFHHARLVGMDLRHKVMRGANLHYADLTEADLRWADLRDADLEGAYLTGTQLQGADLRGANLKNAYAIATNFGDALLDHADLGGVVYDQATTWPSGVRPPRGDVGMWHGRRDG